MKKTNDGKVQGIPFVKPVRVGNYKVWRSRFKVSLKPSEEQRRKIREESGGRMKAVGESYDVEQINVSNLDGSWSVRIPETSMMFATVQDAFIAGGETREQFLGMLFTNFQNITLTPSPALQDALFFLTEMMTYPYLLLSEDEMVKRMSDGLAKDGMDEEKAKAHISEMVEYRKRLYELVEEKKARYIEDYERQLAERRAKAPDEEKQMDDDEMADKAFDILTKEEGGN